MENQTNPQKPDGKGFVKGFFQLFTKNTTSNNTGLKSSTTNQSLEKNNPGYSQLQKSMTATQQIPDQEDEKQQLEEKLAKNQFDEALLIDKETKIKLKEVLDSHRAVLMKRPSGPVKSDQPTSLQSTTAELTNPDNPKTESRKSLFSKTPIIPKGVQSNRNTSDNLAMPQQKEPSGEFPNQPQDSLHKIEEAGDSQELSDKMASSSYASQEYNQSLKDTQSEAKKSKFAMPKRSDSNSGPANFSGAVASMGNKNISLFQRIMGGQKSGDNSHPQSPSHKDDNSSFSSKDPKSPHRRGSIKGRRDSVKKVSNGALRKDGTKNDLLIVEEPETPAKFADHEKAFSVAKTKRRKEKMYLFFNAPHSSKSSLLYNIIILILYVSESALIVVETDISFDLPDDLWVKTSKYYLCIYFLEYVLRLSCYNAFDETFWEFFKKSGNTVDLLAMIYTSVEMFIYEFGDYHSIPAEVKMLRALTILRWIRGFRFSVFNRGRKILSEGLSQSKKPLSILAFFAFLMVICFASLMFTIEANSLTEDDKSNLTTDPIDTIPQAIWWAIITVTTVGYGDSIPISAGGKILSLFALLFGVILISLPVAIMGNKFQDVYLSHKNSMTKKQRNMMKERVDDPKISNEEKEIFKIIVMLNELEEINENIEKHLRNNKFLYRSITRDALNLISKIELTNKASQLQQVAEDNPQEIVASIRRSINKRRKAVSSPQVQS